MNNLNFLQADGNQLSVKPLPCSSINRVIEDALTIATLLNVSVTFDFNGVKLTVNRHSDPNALVQEYHSTLDANYNQLKSSVEGHNSKEKQRKELQETQDEIDTLLYRLDFYLGTDVEILVWLKDFAKLNDLRGLVFDKKALSSKLKSAGYEANAQVGVPAEVIKSDKHLMASYIVGQAISCLDNGIPIHPMLCSFVDEYLNKW